MSKVALTYNGISVEATYLRPSNPNCIVLFAAGSGGNPERHLPLLNSFVDIGCIVIAPHFPRIPSPAPTKEELTQRSKVLHASLDVIQEKSLPVIGVGHSIGASLLVALSGGQLWMQSGQQVDVLKAEQLQKLVLFTPPTGFFAPPKALEGVNLPMQIWAGSLDQITPPQQIENQLVRRLSAQALVDFKVVKGAGHFSFMNTLPPNVIDPMSNREEFLETLGTDVRLFIQD